MASAWYNKGKAKVLDGTINLTSDTIKVMLLNASYSFNADHHFVSDVSANELSGTGYTGGFGGSGRKTLTTKTITEDDTNDWAIFDADDSQWLSINAGTAAWAVLIKEITNDGASLLIAAIDINPDVVTNGANLTVQWNATGILKVA